MCSPDILKVELYHLNSVSPDFFFEKQYWVPFQRAQDHQNRPIIKEVTWFSKLQVIVNWRSFSVNRRGGESITKVPPKSEISKKMYAPLIWNSWKRKKRVPLRNDFFLYEFRLNREKTYFHFRKLTYYWATYCWRLPIWHVFKYFEIVNREIYINFTVIFGVNLFALFCPRVISSARFFGIIYFCII